MKTKSECRSCKEPMDLLDTNVGLRFVCLTDGCPIHTLTTKDVIIYGFPCHAESLKEASTVSGVDDFS